MFKIKPVIIFTVNILLMIASWACYKFPQGDEYLVLFMIPLVFFIAPFILSLTFIGILLAVNVGFLMFYYFTGVLNPIDVVVLTILLASATGASLIVKGLYASFASYQKYDIEGRQKRYNTVVAELESIDHRGRQVENELSRISRLYEITKKLAPTLKFDDLLSSLLDFLEENFRFQTAHLLVCSGGQFSKGISKSTGEKDYSEDEDMMLEYKKVIENLAKREYTTFFVSREEDVDLFESLKVRADTFMVFPMFVGDDLCAVLAIEGAARASYGRFRLLVSQIALEFKKVELYEQVQELSIVDGLTEVYLRRYLMGRLLEEVERAGRLGLTFSIAMIDVDHFKKCNDKYGHLVGDAVLKRIAGRLKETVREVDMIARYGGEEFCVVLPETTKKLAMTVAERLRKSVESKDIKAFDENIRATVSLGMATYPEDGTDVEELLEKADTALYKAKRKGRNIVCAA